MPAKSKPKTASQLWSYFFRGILFELLLILLCVALPEGWLSAEVRNFAIITHCPLMMAMEGVESAPGAIIGLLVGLGFMASIWGFLIFQIVRLGKWSLARLHLNPSQKFLLGCGLGLVGVVGLAMLVIAARPATPTAFTSTPEMQAVVAGNTTFALDLYHKLKSQPGNLFFSPYSISSSLALAGAGARGGTASEMTKLLHFDLSSENTPGAFRALAARMEKIQRWNRIVLKSASSVWCQRDYRFSDAYLKLARASFAAEARNVDFKNSPEAVSREINQWVAGKTNHKITDAIRPDQLAANSKLVLCDGLYFKGTWRNQFKPSDTKPAPFYMSTNEIVTVPMMHGSSRFKTARSEDGSVESLELPYIGNDLSMIILLPTPAMEMMTEDGHNELADLEQKLTGENLHVWLAKLDQANLHKTSVWLPRFTTTQSFDLVPTLKSLGMSSAFGGTADFSGMDGTKNLYISDVLHKSFVEVNESGTEAAAVTWSTATASKDGSFKVDHPFIFLIRENGSGSIFFLGRIVNPTQ